MLRIFGVGMYTYLPLLFALIYDWDNPVRTYYLVACSPFYHLHTYLQVLGRVTYRMGFGRLRRSQLIPVRLTDFCLDTEKLPAPVSLHVTQPARSGEKQLLSPDTLHRSRRRYYLWLAYVLTQVSQGGGNFW